MHNNNRQRILIGRIATITLAACGLVGGYLLGRGLALQLAETGLDHYSKLSAAQDDASFLEAQSLLAVLKTSPFTMCSNPEIEFFREQVFRAQYVKDAGRMVDGKIACSATTSHPSRSAGQFRPDFTREDGTVAYGNLVPIRDASLKRVGLQQGTAYVVLGPVTPASTEAFAMHLSSDTALTSDASGRQGDAVFATRCSTTHFNCVTASASVTEALHSQSELIGGFAVGGGFFGLLFGIAFSSMRKRSRDLCQQLKRAIKRDKLRVVYQPIVKMSNGEIVGAEVLSRWNDDDGNEVGPDVFIKIAEEHGYIRAITKSVVRHTLRTFGETLRKRSDFRISMNVSASDLVDPEFLPMLESSLKRAKVETRSLVIEITERSTADSETAKETIRILQRAGFSIHIDDFGTGYSNLDKLLYLYADAIKIDKAFTKVIGTESLSIAILPQILSLAKSLNLEVVVEGVETERQADYFFPATDKLFGQGWLYGYPVPAEDFLVLLEKGRTNEMVPPDPAATQGARRAGGLQVAGSRIN
jgi:sensor c-di-GMP phosphodiesterase-like protein